MRAHGECWVSMNKSMNKWCFAFLKGGWVGAVAGTLLNKTPRGVIFNNASTTASPPLFLNQQINYEINIDMLSALWRPQWHKIKKTTGKSIFILFYGIKINASILNTKRGQQYFLDMITERIEADGQSLTLPKLIKFITQD